MTKKIWNTTILFYVLVAYIFLQFIWWEVLLVQQTRAIQGEKKNLVALEKAANNRYKEEIERLEKQEQNKIYMIVGEGTVFLIFLSLGIIKVYRTFKKERELNLQQKNFLLSVTHELKSPLTVAKLNMQTLLSRKLNEEDQKQIIQNTIVETERLNRLIENLLLSAQLEVPGSNPVNLIENTDLSLLLKEVIKKGIAPIWQSRLHLEIEEGVRMSLDPVLFPSIILNLVENALKYAPHNTTVKITLNKQGKYIKLKVSDSGPGIPSSERKKIFQKFYRVGNEETRTTKGSGLGLFIVAKMVEWHGGKINLEDNQSSGITFDLSFKQDTVE